MNVNGSAFRLLGERQQHIVDLPQRAGPTDAALQKAGRARGWKGERGVGNQGAGVCARLFYVRAM